MTTLLQVGDSEGAQRCDAKCHTAGEPECDCVCGGRYHGRGSEGATELMQQDLEAGRYGSDLAHLARHLTQEATQAPLF